LPLYIYKTQSNDRQTCNEDAIRVNTAEKYIEQGLMPLVSFRNTDRIRLARFNQSHRRRLYKGKWITKSIARQEKLLILFATIR
jgi:hypothetical protein